MSPTLGQLAQLVGGELEGGGDLVISGARTLQDAGPGDITFVEGRSYLAKLDAARASAAIVPAKLALVSHKALLKVADPIMAFATVLQHLQGKTATAPSGIDPRAVIHPSASIGPEPTVHPFAAIGEGTRIGARCVIHPGAVIGKNCTLGDDVTLHPHVVIYDDSVLGDRVVIHANSVIGSDGFGYRMQQGRHVKVPHLSNIIIGSDVEIGACSCLDRGAFEPTRIGEGTKIDNLVQIAHNVQVGKHNALAAQVGIAGSSSTGNYVFMGGQAGISDHIHVSDRTQFGAKAGVFQDVPAGKRMWLYPAHEDREACRIVASLKKLPQMRRDLLRILKELGLADATCGADQNMPEAPAA